MVPGVGAPLGARQLPSQAAREGRLEMIKVLITDDHRLVRAGFRRLLEDEPNIQVVAEASSGQEALEVVRANAVDVILLDVSMPGENGLEVLPKLKQAAPHACVLMVTMHTEKHIQARAMAAGASGYLLKESAAEELISAIREACRGLEQ